VNPFLHPRIHPRRLRPAGGTAIGIRGTANPGCAPLAFGSTGTLACALSAAPGAPLCLKLAKARALVRLTAIAYALLALLLAGCTTLPGKPTANSETVAPSAILDFATLYAENCAGCHGANGRGGAAIALADPVYLAIVDDATIRKVAADGVRGTAMPAFAPSAGGLLTDKQVDVIATGIRQQWSKPDALGGVNPPSYAAKSPGDATRGAQTYKNYCESCHGSNGRGGPQGSSITDDSFLALISNQGLRTVVIIGRPELGAPDWRADVPGKPMSEQEVTDVVAWLASQRAQNPGQPYAVANSAPH
jgi:cytochrome c oxidase cbb3-type subunit III